MVPARIGAYRAGVNDLGLCFEVGKRPLLSVFSYRLTATCRNRFGSFPMDVSFAYHRRSRVQKSPAGLAIAFAPNLRRDRVSYDGRLKDPLHFREAISALHDVVISDLRYQPRDKTCLLYTSPSPRDLSTSRMPSSA